MSSVQPFQFEPDLHTLSKEDHIEEITQSGDQNEDGQKGEKMTVGQN